MSNKPSINSFDLEDDFGFSEISFTTEEAIFREGGLVDEKEELTVRLQKMYDAIIPLLKNLNRNPDQEIIKWPNRAVKIQEFKNKLDTLGGDFIKKKELK